MVGSGISGLTAAYLLAGAHEVTLYEADKRLGGHTHTHDVTGRDGRPQRVDTGFIVHNDRTYPLLQRLFAQLGVRTRATEMSMSIRSEHTGIEYAGGRGVTGFLARPTQWARGDFRDTMAGVRRFHRLAREFLAGSADTDLTSFGAFLSGNGFGRSFQELYAVPLVSCVWSSGQEDALAYPARYLFQFLDNHGMLAVGGSPRWRTVVGGSSDYVTRIAARLGDIRAGRPVEAIRRGPAGVEVGTAAGTQRHDAVVVATHADQALALLTDASPVEKEVLGAFRYSYSSTLLHTDGSLMPRARWARASWNYLVPERPRVGGPVVTYWMNRLQGLAGDRQIYVSLNADDLIDPAKALARMDYTHPIHDRLAVATQRRLGELATDTTVFAGAYHGWGFHEDGCRSGVQAAAALGVVW